MNEPVAILNVPDADSVGLFVPVNNAPPPELVKVSVAEVSELLKPLPDTATLIPCGPLVGETDREGAVVTVNGAVVPFTDIITGPAVAEPTTKDAPAVITPPPIVQTYEATTFGVTDVTVQIPSPVKPPPVTAIVWPCRPEVGVRYMPG
jgi:hypothetical protein